MVFIATSGPAIDWFDPTARNSNRFPVKAKGLVRFRSPASLGSGGSVSTPTVSVPFACELVAFLVEIHRERAGILREIVVRAPADARIDKRKERLIAHICDRLQPLLLQRRDEIHHPEPEVAARFAFRVVLGVLKETVLFAGPEAHGVPRSDELLSEELGRVFLAYLGVPTGQRA